VYTLVMINFIFIRTDLDGTRQFTVSNRLFSCREVRW